MKFKFVSLFLLFSQIVHAGDPRAIYATSIKDALDVNIFKFPSSLATASRACVFDSSSIPVSSSVTSTELGYSSGVTSAIQTQLDAKQSTGNYITALTGGVTASGPGSVAATLHIASSDLPAPTASAISAADIDWSTLLKTGGVYTKTLGASTAFTFSNISVGAVIVRITNTASNYAATFPSTVCWSGGTSFCKGTQPVQSTGVRADIWTFVNDGASTFGSVIQNF